MTESKLPLADNLRLIREEMDELGWVGYAQDLRQIDALLRQQHEALVAVTELYVDLGNSGDAGFWDPELVDEIKAARAAIAAAEDKS